MSMNEARTASPERDSLMDTPPNSTSDTGSDSYSEMSPTESPSGFSPFEESTGSYKSLSPFARLKLKRKIENSYFKPISQTSDDRIPGSSLPGMVGNKGQSAFRSVNNNESSQNGCNNNKNTVNLIKLHQIKSAFTLSEDRDIPTGAVSLGHMFALKKRIIKREALNEELNGGEGSGSDGLSEPSFDGDSPQNLKEEATESDNDEHRLKVWMSFIFTVVN